MKKHRFFLFALYCLLSTVFLWGCGGGAGAPGSSGSKNTGILISAPHITRESPDIDVIQDDDACDGEPEKPLTAERATLQFFAEKLNPNSTFNPFPASLEQCTITYKKVREDPSAPTLESLTIFPNCRIEEKENECNVMVIDIERKRQYAMAAFLNGSTVPAEYPTHYVAQYNCKYMNNNGKSDEIQTEYDLWLADWLRCD